MNRNRRIDRDERVSGAAWVVLVIFLLASSGLGYVWQKSQINQLGVRKRTLENELSNLKQAVSTAEMDINSLQTLAKIEEKVKAMNLGLSYPQPEQVIRLADAPWTGFVRSAVVSNNVAPPVEGERR